MRPWKVFKQFDEKKVDERNLINVASVLYHAVIEVTQVPIKVNTRS
jgi:hypothetical protein